MDGTTPGGNERTGDDAVRHIVHDLRSPLHAVLGFIDLAREDNDDPAVAAHLERAAGSAQHLASLIGELSRLAPDERRPTATGCQTVEILDTVIAELRVFHGHGHQVSVEIGDGSGSDGSRDDRSGTVLADPHLLRRVLTNLIGNALRHTPTGTTVTVVVGPATRTDGGCRRTIRIDDDGPGIGRNGPGLGLVLVGELVARMTGTFTIGDRPGGGTRALVELPAPCPPM